MLSEEGRIGWWERSKRADVENELKRRAEQKAPPAARRTMIVTAIDATCKLNLRARGWRAREASNSRAAAATLHTQDALDAKVAQRRDERALLGRVHEGCTAVILIVDEPSHLRLSTSLSKMQALREHEIRERVRRVLQE